MTQKSSKTDIFNKTATFEFAVNSLQNIQQFGLPKTQLPEVAIAGASNVGKSSIINALTNRKSLARTSCTPGQTRQINFFNIANKLMLVDLPGYGYAKISKSTRNDWGDLIYHYFNTRSNLKGVIMLVDARRGLRPHDIQLMELLDGLMIGYQITLTKIDKVKKDDVEKILSAIKLMGDHHPSLHPEILATSSIKKKGIDQLKQAIVNLSKFI